jgi:hypothetical protein
MLELEEERGGWEEEEQEQEEQEEQEEGGSWPARPLGRRRKAKEGSRQGVPCLALLGSTGRGEEERVGGEPGESRSCCSGTITWCVPWTCRAGGRPGM